MTINSGIMTVENRPMFSAGRVDFVATESCGAFHIVVDGELGTAAWKRLKEGDKIRVYGTFSGDGSEKVRCSCGKTVKLKYQTITASNVLIHRSGKDYPIFTKTTHTD